MKKLVLALSLMISSSSFAAASYRLQALSCTASNGVSLSTVKKSQDGSLKIASTWGVFRQDFQAELGLVGTDTDSVIHLKNEEGEVMYNVRLPLDPEMTKVQTAVGDIVSPGSARDNEATLMLATISCNVKIAKMTTR